MDSNQACSAPIRTKPRRKSRAGFLGNTDATRRCWRDMLKRCLNERHRDYKDYGGRGITVCPRWLEFSGFYADMGDKPAALSLDRKNNDKGYSPENCRWASMFEQGQNKRNSVILTAFGETKTMGLWLRDIRRRVTRGTIVYRMQRGWSAEKAIGTPPGPRGSYRRI
jgi:hypothetical protein